jgi:hypothetical protein
MIGAQKESLVLAAVIADIGFHARLSLIAQTCEPLPLPSLSFLDRWRYAPS